MLLEYHRIMSVVMNKACFFDAAAEADDDDIF